MGKVFLPLGSVVLLKNGTKRLMICGRIQVREGNDIIYDYSGVLYPEGIIGPNSMFFFNEKDIERIYFVGFQDEEELMYNGETLSQLGELEVRDGVIVEKQQDADSKGL